MIRTFVIALICGVSSPHVFGTSDSSVNTPAQWRAEHRVIDLHQHLDGATQHLARAVKILDAAGVGVTVNLSGGTVTPGKEGGLSEFEHNKQLADLLYPGRFLQYVNLDYARWNEPDFAARCRETGRRSLSSGSCRI